MASRSQFSQRYGYRPLKSELQLESIDDALRNRLWTCYLEGFWQPLTQGETRSTRSSSAGLLLWRYWVEYFAQPSDTLPDSLRYFIDNIRTYFFRCNWYEIYDFFEFTLTHVDNISWSDNRIQDLVSRFVVFCNLVLESENSGYRIVAGQVIRIIDEVEVESIDTAIEAAHSYPGVSAHLRTATMLLADRANPNYRNSIKESISAVEGICNAVTGKQHSGIAPGLDALAKKISIDVRLKVGFEKIYAYTSSADGIRHSLANDESAATFTDAKFMLVACSAFVNYVIGKIAEKNAPNP